MDKPTDRPGHRPILAALALLVAGSAAALAGTDATPGPKASAAPAALPVPAVVDLPGGVFAMGDLPGDGDPDERPVHEVTIRAFRLGRTEVTVAEFAAFVTATGYVTDAERDAGGHPGCIGLGVDPAKSTYVAGQTWRQPGYPQESGFPVVCVSYADAGAYVGWLAAATGRPFRLPSEAEWEYAARAGTKGTWPWGEDGDGGCAEANGADETPGPGGERWTQKMRCADGHFYPAPAGSYRPNAFGLYDLIGNVWEWTADCYVPGYGGAPTDGSPRGGDPCPKRAVRGGAWPYPPGWLRTANRGGSNAELRANDRGFRVAEDRRP